MTLPPDELLAKAATLDTFSLAKLPDGSVLIENPLGLTQLVFTRLQWVKAVDFVNTPTLVPREEEA